jgi:hypothetical protein
MSEIDQLRAFVTEVMRMDWEGYDIDGGDAQNLAQKHGLLREEPYVLTKDELIQALESEIERLRRYMAVRAEVHPERQLLDRIGMDFEAMRERALKAEAEIERLRAERDEWQRALRNIEIARQEGLDEIERLRAALLQRPMPQCEECGTVAKPAYFQGHTKDCSRGRPKPFVFDDEE